MGKRATRNLSLTALLATLLASAYPAPALADAAPPLTPPASSIGADSPTAVQMWSEVVELDARGLIAEDGVILVHARFRMRNTGSAPEYLRVRFPLEHPWAMGDGYGSYPTIEGLSVQVDSQLVQTAEILEPTYWEQIDAPIRWATFNVLFPLGRDVIITVEYTVHAAAAEFGTRLDYVMETGRGWAGSIERAEIIVRLPYTATRAAYLAGWQSDAWSNPVFSSDTLRWVRWHIEPTEEDNFEALLVPPHLWHQILTLQRRIANWIATENDYLAQAEAYWRASKDRHGWTRLPGFLAAAEAVANSGLRRFPGNQDLIAEEAFFRLESTYNFDPSSGPNLTPSEQALVDSARCQIARAQQSGSSSDIVQTAAAIYGIRRPEIECATAGDD